MSWIIISNHHFTVYSFFLEIKGIPFFQKLPNFRKRDIILVISHYSPRKKLSKKRITTPTLVISEDSGLLLYRSSFRIRKCMNIIPYQALTG